MKLMCALMGHYWRVATRYTDRQHQYCTECGKHRVAFRVDKGLNDGVAPQGADARWTNEVAQ